MRAHAPLPPGQSPRLLPGRSVTSAARGTPSSIRRRSGVNEMATVERGRASGPAPWVSGATPDRVVRLRTLGGLLRGQPTDTPGKAGGVSPVRLGRRLALEDGSH